MRVLSLFDGMSCGQIALERAGIPIEAYYASETDKHAIKVTMANYPNTIQLGDVRYVSAANLPKIDLLIGGSPCQGFSFAGKGLNFEDPRSKLFFEYVRILKECQAINPNVLFLLENVKMKREYQNIITEHLGAEPIEINSSLVSAQSRKRLYWTNISGVEHPEDKGLFLKDIIESGSVDRDKSYCIDANYFKGGSLKNYLEKSRRQIVNLAQSEKRLMVHESLSGRIVGRKLDENGTRKDYSDIKAVQTIEVNENPGKTNTLTSVQKDNVIIQKARGFNDGGLFFDKSPTLSSNSWQHNNHLTDGYSVRKLTPLECERLQTVPDNYTAHVSNTQRYKMLGNGWTVDVIAHIFKHINNDQI